MNQPKLAAIPRSVLGEPPLLSVAMAQQAAGATKPAARPMATSRANGSYCWRSCPVR
ncbi:MAG: hypothetical protein U1E73_06305 [Planctomycetota bacterium]